MTEEELEEYLKTHYEVVKNLEYGLNGTYSNAKLISYYEKHGIGGIWELAKSITDDFQFIHRNREWDGEWLDELEKYVTLRIDQL